MENQLEQLRAAHSCHLDDKKYIDAQNMLKLLRWGWVLEGGLWSNPKHIDNKRRLLFTFEQAVKAEGL